MRLYELTEAHPTDYIWREAAEYILTKCKPYIEEVGTPLVVMYRGHEMKTPGRPVHRKYRDNRRPRDSSEDLMKLFNDIIRHKGGTAMRNNSIFATGNRIDASDYGDVYVVFPVGEFDYTYSLDVLDWWSTYDRIMHMHYWNIRDKLGFNDPHFSTRQPTKNAEIKDEAAELAYDEIAEKIENSLVVNHDLREGILTGTEIMISAKSGYYYVPYQSFDRVALELESYHIGLTQQSHPNVG